MSRQSLSLRGDFHFLCTYMFITILSQGSKTDFHCRLRVASCAWRSKEKGVRRNPQPATHIDFQLPCFVEKRNSQPATHIDFHLPCFVEKRNSQPATHIDFHLPCFVEKRNSQPATHIDFQLPCFVEKRNSQPF